MFRLQSTSNFKRLSSIHQHTTWLAAQRHLYRHEEITKQWNRETPFYAYKRESPKQRKDKQVALQTL